MEIAVEYKNRPVDSFDYTYFDGQNWSNIYSARDGRGVIELSPGAITDNIRIKCEYEYRNEAHIDNEIENVFNIVKGQAFRKSYITVSGAAVNATQPEQNAAVPAIETSETNSIASAIDETPYRLIMDNVLNAIASKTTTPPNNTSPPMEPTCSASSSIMGKPASSTLQICNSLKSTGKRCAETPPCRFPSATA